MKQDQTENLAKVDRGMPKRYRLPIMVLRCIILLLLITACSSSRQDPLTPEVTPTSRPSLTKPPATSPTALPSSTPQPTFAPTVSQSSGSTTPTATPTVTPLPIFDLLAGNANPLHYQLATPEPENLAHVIINSNEHLWDGRMGAMPSDSYQQALSNDSAAVFRTAIFELQVHYTYGLPDPRLAFSIHGHPFIWGDEYSWFMPILQGGIFDLLRDQELYDQQIIDIENIEAKIFQAELDGDPGIEWLAVANLSQYFLLTWLRIDTLPDGTYQLMPYDPDMFNFRVYLNDPTLVEGVGDFNSDGLTDILLNAPLYLAGGYNYHFYFVQGSSAGFEVTSEIEAHAFETDGYLGYSVSQPPETEHLSLTITVPVDLNWGCHYDTITTYEWYTGDLRSTEEGAEPPLTAECYLARAVTLRKPLNPDTDIPLLQQAIALFTEDDPEEIPKIAFAHYRLAVLYALRHEYAQARAHLEAFLDFNRLTDSELVETVDKDVTGLLSVPRLDPLTLCSWIAGTPYTYFPDWSIFTNETAAEHAYPFSNEISPRALCPWSQVVDWILESVTVVPGISPANALTSAGLPVITAQSLWLPGWPEPAWLVLLQSDPYNLISYRPWEEENLWKEEVWFTPNSGEAIWLNQDITGDGYPEIAFAVPLLDPSGARTGSYQVSITSMVAEGIILEVMTLATIPAGEQFDLAEFLVDQDGDGYVDIAVAKAVLWYDALPPLEPADPPIWPTTSEWSDTLRSYAMAQSAQDVEPEALSALFEGADPAETRAMLTQMLQDTQGTDPAASLFRQRLLYLIGLSYEMEGQADLAVASGYFYPGDSCGSRNPVERVGCLPSIPD